MAEKTWADEINSTAFGRWWFANKHTLRSLRDDYADETGDTIEQAEFNEFMWTQVDQTKWANPA